MERNKKFEVDNIPDLSNELNDTTNNVVAELYSNYKRVTLDSKILLEDSLEKNISKSLTIYNLLFMIELYLKYYLLDHISIEEIGGLQHRIYDLIEKTKENEFMGDFEELIQMLRRFKRRNGQNVDYNRYYDFRYNHRAGQSDLIFDYELTDREKNIVKDVIKWLDSNLLNV